MVDIACGTGLNFPLTQEVIGSAGRIVGVDLTDAMLAQAQRRLERNRWSNISLVEADAADFDFPARVDAILSTYGLSQVPECAKVVVHGAAALSHGGRWVVLDLKVPDNTPRWPLRVGTAIVRPFAAIDEWILHRPWEAIRVAMREELADVSWTELAFGTAFLAAGSSDLERDGMRPAMDDWVPGRQTGSRGPRAMIRAMGKAKISVRVRAGTARDEVAGVLDGVLLVRVSAPAQEGRANRVLCRLLAKRLGVAPSRVVIVRGQRSREKLVEVDGVDQATVDAALARGGPPSR